MLFDKLRDINGAALLGCVTIGLFGGETAHCIGAVLGVIAYGLSSYYARNIGPLLADATPEPHTVPSTKTP